MDTMISNVLQFGDSRLGGGDDFTDQLNSKYTVYLLVALSVIVSTNHYIAEAISCWCPNNFTDAQVEYTKSACWSRRAYRVPKVSDYYDIYTKGNDNE
ncbi:unnamed protein product [Dimorphilus gyrociliatus]|uniref:Innexin n=1 Tax=Dimorphilus gyrociliatus TaxID=2664684 RepID=A0A7I8VTQ4_9ANNE|nr:unnamed protein product [Dimorphilus gyrociliatus]